MHKANKTIYQAFKFRQGGLIKEGKMRERGMSINTEQVYTSKYTLSPIYPTSPVDKQSPCHAATA